MKSRLFWASTAAAALAALAGCGGSSSSDQTAKFKTDYVSVTNQLRGTSNAIGTEFQHASKQTDAQIYAALRPLTSRWQAELSQLQALKPPAKVAADFNSVTTAAARSASDLNAILVATRTHSAASAEQAFRSLVNDISAAKTANKALKQKLGIS